MSIGLCVVYCLVEGVITDLVHISPTSGTSGAAAHATATFSELMAHWAAKEAASGGWHHVIPDNTTGDLSSYNNQPHRCSDTGQSTHYILTVEVNILLQFVTIP